MNYSIVIHRLCFAWSVLVLMLLAGIMAPSAAVAQGTVFSYQGRLNQNGAAANGRYDLAFSLFGTESGGVPVGPSQTNSAVIVTDGLFIVALDFGTNFPGASRWLEIFARSNNLGDFVMLSPRQKVTPTPYAITAANVSGVLPNTGLLGTYSNAVTFSNSGNSFSGNGGGLSGVNAIALGGLSASQFWRTMGNSGTANPANFLGTLDNQALDLRVNASRALRLQPGSNGVPSIVAGGISNNVSAGTAGATIAGGNRNFIESFGAAASDFAAIGGGSSNQIGYFSFNSVIGGGHLNVLQPNDYFSVIAGGLGNEMGFHAVSSVISGGQSNRIDTSVDTVAIGGGRDNFIGFLAHFAAIGAGRNNLIRSNSEYAVISGGRDNTIEADAKYARIGGGERNRLGGGWHGTISGGAGNSIAGDSGTIAGGLGHFIGSNSYEAVISGGNGNTIHTNAERVTIAGGVFHEVDPGAAYSVIGGGTRHKAGTNSMHATISGGSNNTIGNNTSYSSIGGGKLHTIGPDSAHVTIAGGDGNTASGEASAIGGGTLNVIEPATTYSVIAGGGGNRVSAGSFGATVAGGYVNQASGNFSFAAGQHAQAVHANTFAWAGGNTMPYASIFPSSFNIYSSNGVSMDYGPQSAAQPRGARYVYIGPFNAGLTISAWNGARLTDGGIWSNASDRNRKTDFHQVNPREVLEKLISLPVGQWRYTNEDAGIKHLGPVAQDFQATFGLGHDDTSIGTVDADGVALAAIQGLNQKLQEELKRRDQENAELRERLAKLERLLQSQER